MINLLPVIYSTIIDDRDSCDRDVSVLSFYSQGVLYRSSSYWKLFELESWFYIICLSNSFFSAHPTWAVFKFFFKTSLDFPAVAVLTLGLLPVQFGLAHPSR